MSWLSSFTRTIPRSFSSLSSSSLYSSSYLSSPSSLTLPLFRSLSSSVLRPSSPLSSSADTATQSSPSSSSSSPPPPPSSSSPVSPNSSLTPSSDSLFRYTGPKSFDADAEIAVPQASKASLNALLYPYRAYRTFSRKTLREAIRRRSRPYWLSTAEFKKSQYPTFPEGVRKRRHSDKTTEERDFHAEGRHLLSILNHEERDRIVAKHPRSIQKFRAGDQIIVTRYMNLYSDKYERIGGTVLATHGKPTSVKFSFTIINTIENEPFEMQMPLYSPYIKKIEVVKKCERTRHNRAKRYYIRDLEQNDYKVDLPHLEGADILNYALLPNELEERKQQKIEQDKKFLEEFLKQEAAMKAKGGPPPPKAPPKPAAKGGAAKKK